MTCAATSACLKFWWLSLLATAVNAHTTHSDCELTSDAAQQQECWPSLSMGQTCTFAGLRPFYKTRAVVAVQTCATVAPHSARTGARALGLVNGDACRRTFGASSR